MQYCLQHYISNKYRFIKILCLTYQTIHTLDWIYNIHKIWCCTPRRNIETRCNLWLDTKTIQHSLVCKFIMGSIQLIYSYVIAKILL